METEPTTPPRTAVQPAHHGAPGRESVSIDVDAAMAHAERERTRASAPPTHEELAGLVPGTCEGAMCFNSMCIACCLFTFIVPLAVLLPLYLDMGHAALLAFVIAMPVAGCLFCCFSVRRCATYGGACMPDPPERSMPLSQTQEGSRTHEQLDVKTVTIIYNPFGGTQQARALAELAKEVMEMEYHCAVTLLASEHAGHTRELAKSLDLEGINALCVCGGDGSIHELVNGFCERGEAEVNKWLAGNFALGFIPGGSGNSVCRDMGVIDPRVAARNICLGDACWVDVNRVDLGADLPVLSVNLIALGIVGDVGIVAEDWRCLGPGRYDVCALWTMLKKITKGMKVFGGRADDPSDSIDVDGPVVSLFINQTQYFGKGLRAAPRAKWDDGLMDLGMMTSGRRDEVGARSRSPRVGGACMLAPPARPCWPSRADGPSQAWLDN